MNHDRIHDSYRALQSAVQTLCLDRGPCWEACGLISPVEETLGSNKIMRLVLERASVFRFMTHREEVKGCEQAVEANQRGDTQP